MAVNINWQKKKDNCPLGPTEKCLSINEMNVYWLENPSGLHKIIKDHTASCEICKNNLNQHEYNLRKTAEYLGGSVYNE